MVLTVSVGGPGFDHLHYTSFQHEQDIKRLLMPNGSGILMGRHYFDHIRYENRGAKVMLFKQAFNRHGFFLFHPSIPACPLIK
jgi:hypothetical protein